MKTFEERYTAWIDGKLEGADLQAFEKELDDRPAAESDRASAHALGNLLRNSQVPALKNADFFNHQLMQRIDQDQTEPSREAAPASSWASLLWVRFAAAGALAVMLGWGISRTLNPVHPERPPQGPGVSGVFTAQIIDVKPADSTISASVVKDDDDENVKVLWLDGLEYLPASYELK